MMKVAEKLLYSPSEVCELIQCGKVTLVDIRDREEYRQGHIPGAVNIPQLFYYLAESSPEGLEAMSQELEMLIRRAGISSDRTLIVYEESLDTRYGGSCRGYWLLTYAGHSNVGVLDGGLAAWRKEGLTLEPGEVVPPPSVFQVFPRRDMIATKEQVFSGLENSNLVLLDNRDEVEWQGLSSSPYGIDFAPQKGRIPKARWIEWYTFLERDADPVVFKSPEAIRTLCTEQRIGPDDDIILYCFKGARSSNTYIALRLAGFSKVRLFLGSWNEWSRDFSLPVREGTAGEHVKK